MFFRMERKRQIWNNWIRKWLENLKKLRNGTKWSEMLINSKVKRQNNSSNKNPLFLEKVLLALIALGHPITLAVASLGIPFFGPFPIQPFMAQVMPASSMNSSSNWSTHLLLYPYFASFLLAWMNYLCVHLSKLPLPPVP